MESRTVTSMHVLLILALSFFVEQCTSLHPTCASLLRTSPNFPQSSIVTTTKQCDGKTVLFGSYMTKKIKDKDGSIPQPDALRDASFFTLLLARLKFAVSLLKKAWYTSAVYALFNRIIKAPLVAWAERNKKFTVYALELENGKFYVGSTGRTGRKKNQRWKEHTSTRGGSAWTRKHKPVRVLAEHTGIPRQYYLGFESALTAKLMLERGIHNVRGAQFADPRDFTSEDLVSLIGFLGHHLQMDYKVTEEWLRGVLVLQPSMSEELKISILEKEKKAVARGVGVDGRLSGSGRGGSRGKVGNGVKDVGGVGDKLDKVDKGTGGVGGGNRLKADTTCFRCGKVGHWVKQCREAVDVNGEDLQER